jgi:hypothetical protein
MNYLILTRRIDDVMVGNAMPEQNKDLMGRLISLMGLKLKMFLE